MSTHHGDYRICPQAELDDLPARLHALNELTFGSYPGVIVPSPAFMRWYCERPGMDRELSLVALAGEELVASVFVTVVPLRLGGELRPTGIVDTVMTHPEHRRRGLARRLLSEAVHGMRARGLGASLLYTVPGSAGYHLYLSLGYRPHAPAHYWRRTQPMAGWRALVLRRADMRDSARLAAFLNTHFAGHDGHVSLDGDLWRWHKVERPAELPASVYYVEAGGSLQGCVTVCRASITGSPHGASYILADLAIAPGTGALGVLESLLSTIPAGADVMTLAAHADASTVGLLSGAGFQAQAGEVGMVLALAPEAERALATPPERWYVLAESVIGV